METDLRRAIDSAKSSSSISQEDYYVLIKWAGICGSDGREAADALGYARDNNKLRNVFRRDEYAESRYLKPAGQYKSSGGCYLTTACLCARGKLFDDNCYELTLLRHFRDFYLAKQPQGRQEIDYYYQVAPKIVSAINKDNNAQEIYHRLYLKMIVPVVKLIENGKKELAYQHYKKFTLGLENWLNRNRQAK